MRGRLAYAAAFLTTAFTLALVPYYGVMSDAAILDPDIWWHIRTGDWIAQHHAVPHAGIFSQLSGRPWAAYSWGFELFVSGLNQWFDIPSIPGLLIVVQVITSMIFLLALKHIAGRYWPAAAIAAVSLYALNVNSLRPVLATMLFFVLELALIFEVERTGQARLLYWLAPLMVIWANCHAQFVYGIGVLGLYAASGLVARFTGVGTESRAAETSPATLVGALAAALVAPCVGPYGPALYGVVARLGTNTQQYNMIAELAALSFRLPRHFVQLGIAMAAFFVLGWTRRRDWFRPLLLAAATLIAFRSTRDSWFVIFTSAFVLAEAARQRWPQQEERLRGEFVLYAGAMVVALAAVFGIAVQRGITVPALATKVSQAYPIGASEFVQKNKLPGPMFNTFLWGGFLIYNLPGVPVSVDGRVELYGTEMLLRQANTEAAIDWQSDPNLKRANFIVMERWRPLAGALLADPHYKVAFQDRISLVFVRQDNGDREK